MPAEVRLPLVTLYGFLLVLARVSGAVSFVPFPGLRQAPVAGRVVLALAITVALLPVWPRVSPGDPGLALLAGWIAAELAFGVAVGLAVGFLNEAFIFASQIFGLQAGYGYASTIDPATQADSTVLQLFSHLASGLLFFAMDFHLVVIRIFTASLTALPPGDWFLGVAAGEQLLQLGSVMFTTAVRLALPVVALLVLVDIALALLGRINAEMQLLMLAFPAKMLATMALLAALTVVLPTLYGSAATRILGGVAALLNPEP